MKIFPDYLEQVESLIEDHKKLNDQPLVFALYYDVPRQPNDVYVLEVLLQVGLPTEETEFFDAEFSSSPGFQMDDDSTLHIVLTDTITFMRAIDWKWPQYNEIREAASNGKCKVIYRNDSLGASQFLGPLTEKIFA
jgi:hypothetical protein